MYQKRITVSNITNLFKMYLIGLKSSRPPSAQKKFDPLRELLVNFFGYYFSRTSPPSTCNYSHVLMIVLLLSYPTGCASTEPMVTGHRNPKKNPEQNQEV